MVIIGFVALFLAYAIIVLTEQAETNESMASALPVRTDLMRDQACHVANATIMGNCTEEEIAALQHENAPLVVN